MLKTAFMSAALALLTYFQSTAQCETRTFTGQGTYYNYSGGGNCSFPDPYTTLYSAALNASQYSGAVLCGACAEITGERGRITVSLEDQCPECMPGDIDLEKDAFPLIADPVKGRVPIVWRIVPCPVNGPVEFYFKEGSSQYWTAVQVRNHRNPLTKLEFLQNNNFIEIPRVSYNYFEYASGMGPGPYTLRITDDYGNQITERGVSLAVTTVIRGRSQFPDCSSVLSVSSADNNSHDFSYSVSGLSLRLENKHSESTFWTLYQANGLQLSQGQLSPFSSEEVSLRNSGLYLLHIKTGDSVRTLKLNL